MPVKLYMDEHVPRSITEGLRERGVNVLTVQEDSRTMSKDEPLLARSTELGRLIVTNDPDFLKLAQRWSESGSEFAGIVFWSQQTIPIGKCIDQLELVCQAGYESEFRNRVQFLPL